MKFNIGDFVKIVESDQVRYGRITNAVFNDWYWYEIDFNPGTYFNEAFIMLASEEDISSVNDSEMDQIFIG